MKNAKKIKIILILISACGIFCIALVFILNKYSIPTKQERLNNMITYQGKTQFDKNDVVNEIEAIFKKHTNWDNLFISENFKNKYNDRKGLISEVDDYSNIWCAGDESDQENIVVVYCDKKENNLNIDKVNDVTVEYYFQYVVNENNEIDDLILIKKYDTYTLNEEKYNYGSICKNIFIWCKEEACSLL